MLKFEAQKSINFEDLTGIQAGWDFEAAQLSPVVAESRVVLYETEHVRYNQFRLNAAFEQRLCARSGFVSFGMLSPDCPRAWLQDQEISRNALIVFPRDEVMQAASPIGFRGNGMHFTLPFLTYLAEVIYHKPLTQVLPPTGLYEPDMEKLQAIRAEFYKWQQLARTDVGSRAFVIARREESLALAILDGLTDARPSEQQVLLKSDRGLNLALELIHDSDLENISAVELCRNTDISQRSLEKCFVKRFGVTTKKYIKCLRLAKVRRGLLNFDKANCESIIELAGIQGFWHMGQFAADYRRLYGELPSETLRVA
jgi:AraC family ethanolamine operon transcriptional activator